MQMKNKRRILGALSLSTLALGLIAEMESANAAPVAGIAGTRHNLGASPNRVNGLVQSTGAAREGDLFSNGTDEICVFCHTPHGSAATTAVNAPLWNKAAPSTANYNVYVSGTMQGTAGVAAGSMSLACLSCHDGTQAMDNMINSPGASGYTAGGARGGNATSPGGTAVTGAWSNLTDTNLGIMQSGAGVVMLGTDLSNDHPIGMAYCGGGAAVGNITTCADQDFKQLDSAAVNGGSFYVGTTGQQRERMRIYGAAATSATVECGSCHDPHNAVNKTFLRTSNAGSAVCLSCHTK